ncbi:hypothetical protein RHGRI_038711 [Rhododendron griersonianum]|uniref:Uncharacterized protein n=1 Tax=Rhododendron griersonianum TaxID=479676 RepID=A0AAV6HJD1_9ERIC|nr:hypothetical protein RHGRI_038711 [Rhododendron griersonianum]
MKFLSRVKWIEYVSRSWIRLLDLKLLAIAPLMDIICLEADDCHKSSFIKENRGVERPGLFFVIRLMMDAIGPLELSLQAKSKHGCWMTKLSSTGDIGDESRVSVALPPESFLSLTMRNRESMKINGERSRIIMYFLFFNDRIMFFTELSIVESTESWKELHEKLDSFVAK